MWQSTAEELELQLDENLDLLWSLLYRDDDDGVREEPILVNGEFVKHRKFIESPSFLITPAGPPVYARCSDQVRVVGRHAPTKRDAECAVCGDVTFIVANAAAWRLPLTGEVILNALRRWHHDVLEAEPLGRRYLEEDGVPVPLCQLCVDLLIDTEDLERRLVDGVETVLGVPEDLKPDVSFTEEDEDVKPDLQDVASFSGFRVEEGLRDPLSLETVQAKARAQAQAQARRPRAKPRKRGGRSALPRHLLGERKPVKRRSQGVRDWDLPTYEVQRPEPTEEDENADGRRRSRRARRTLAMPVHGEIVDSDEEEEEEMVVESAVKPPRAPKTYAKKPKKSTQKEAPSQEEDEVWVVPSGNREGSPDDDDDDYDDDDDDDEDELAVEVKKEDVKEKVKRKPRKRVDKEEPARVPVGSDIWLKAECRLCDAEFPNHALLTEHFSQLHRGTKFPYVCHFCLCGFSKPDAFSCHVMCEELRREAERGFTCGVCEKDCANPRLLAVHFSLDHAQVTDRDRLPFACAECPTSFASYVRFVEHRRKAHAAEVKPSDPVRPVQCPSCKLVFRCSSMLGNHLRVVEFNANRVCEPCGIRFPGKGARDKHDMAVHGAKKKKYSRRKRDNEPCPCPICGKVVQRVKAHVRKIHTRPKRVPCSVCDERFANRDEVVEHEVEVHRVGVERLNLPCPECGKTFRRPDYIRRHRLSVHGVVPDGQKLFVCHLCGKKFHEEWRLTAHVDSHEGNRRHQCPKCDHKTVTFVNLQSHLKWKHRVLVRKVMHEWARSGYGLGYDIIEIGPWEPPPPKRKKEAGDGSGTAASGRGRKEGVGVEYEDEDFEEENEDVEDEN